MLKRFPLVIFALGLVVSGCQEKPAPASLFGGSSDIKVLEARYVSSNDAAVGSVGGTAQSYLIFRVHLTNDISQQLFVVPSHFVFTAQDGNRYAGIDSGSSALVGISNDYSPLTKGQGRDFIVAFRTPIEQAGTVSYEY